MLDLPGGGAVVEYLGKDALRALGVAVPQGGMAVTVDEAVAVAARIGYPVVLKAQAGRLSHKSDAGGVIVGLRDEAALRAGWDRLIANIEAAAPGLVLDGVLVATDIPLVYNDGFVGLFDGQSWVAYDNVRLSGLAQSTAIGAEAAPAGEGATTPAPEGDAPPEPEGETTPEPEGDGAVPPEATPPPDADGGDAGGGQP